jgi:hypothetical protein
MKFRWNRWKKKKEKQIEEDTEFRLNIMLTKNDGGELQKSILSKLNEENIKFVLLPDDNNGIGKWLCLQVDINDKEQLLTIEMESSNELFEKKPKQKKQKNFLLIAEGRGNPMLQYKDMYIATLYADKYSKTIDCINGEQYGPFNDDKFDKFMGKLYDYLELGNDIKEFKL